MKPDDETGLVNICPVHKCHLLFGYPGFKCADNGESWSGVPDTARRILALGTDLRYAPLTDLARLTPERFQVLLRELSGMADGEVFDLLRKRFPDLMREYFVKCSEIAAGHPSFPPLRVPHTELGQDLEKAAPTDPGGPSTEGPVDWSIKSRREALYQMLYDFRPDALVRFADEAGICIESLNEGSDANMLVMMMVMQVGKEYQKFDALLSAIRRKSPHKCKLQGF